MCVSLCVCLWMGGQRILSSAFLTGVGVSRGTPLSTLMQRPYKELWLQKPARSGERTKDVGQLGVRLRSRARNSWPRCRASQFSDVGPEQSESGMESRTKTQNSKDDDQMSQHLW